MSELKVYSRLISRWDAWAQQALTPDDRGRYGYLTKKELLTDEIIKNRKTLPLEEQRK